MLHMPRPKQKIAFQGEPGANSHIACQEVYPKAAVIPCATFEDCFAAVREARADFAMIPIDNSVAGRVADIHHLLPDSRLHIVGEHFLPIQFQLMAVKGTRLKDIRSVHSHTHALGQCRKIIRKHRWQARVEADTAGAARLIAESGDPTQAALAPRLAAWAAMDPTTPAPGARSEFTPERSSRAPSRPICR